MSIDDPAPLLAPKTYRFSDVDEFRSSVRTLDVSFTPLVRRIAAVQTVLQNIKKVRINNNWILGGSFRWSTKTNDPLNAKFYIFQIQSNGSYKLVG